MYYSKHDAKFPSDTTEKLGRFVGIAENVGHAMTYKILNEDGLVISRAVVRTAMKGGGFENKRAKKQASDIQDDLEPVTVSENDDDDDQEPVEEFAQSIKEDIIKSLHEDRVNRGEGLPNVDSLGLLGRSFIPNPDDHGEQHRSKVEGIELTDQQTADGKDLFKFKCKVGDKVFEEIMTYNKMLEWCERDADKDDMYRIESIIGHRRNRKARGGWQLKIQWASGEVTWEDLSPIYNDDQVSVSLYARQNGLLGQPGFQRCKHHTKSDKKFARMINQARLRNFRNKPVYQYGYQVPRNHDEAVFIDERMGNTKWQDAEKLEMQQLFEYDTFKDLGKGTPIPSGYQKIPCHMIYTVKHDGRHKARLVAGGHCMETPLDGTYSSVVSLPGLRLVTYLAEHNDLELWGTDIGNAYLESYTKEKICFITGGEFGDLAGHTFMIHKAL